MINKRKMMGGMVWALGWSISAQAGPAQQEAVVQEAVVVVTANRVAQSIQDVDASIEVIDRAQLARFAGRSLAEVLQFSTGVRIQDSGSGASIAIRGFQGGHTLLLVDGLRRTEKYAGSNINNISLANVERIEIVRGPMSALYGSDALGGVVNIITRKAQTPQTRVRISGGGVDLTQGRESWLVQAGKDWVSAGVSQSVSMELKRRQPYTSTTGALNQERRTFLNYRADLAVGSHGQLQLGGEYLRQNDRHGDAATGRFEKETRYQLTARYQQPVNDDTLALDLAYGATDATVNRSAGDELTDFNQTQFEARYTGLAGAHVQHLYTIGLGYRYDDAAISINQRAADRHLTHLLAQDQWSLGETVDLTVGIRHDHYSDFGATTTPRLTLAWRPGDWWMRAGVATAFKAPTLLQLYARFNRRNSLIMGNPDLQPEESLTYELSAGYRHQAMVLELALFHSQVEQLIMTAIEGRAGNCPGRRCQYLYRYRNLNQATLQGAEFTAAYQLAPRYRLHTSISYLDARDDLTGLRLSDRARWQGQVTLDADWNGALSGQLRGRYQGDYYAPYGRTVPAYDSHFASLDLNLHYQVRPELTVFTGVDNLLDRDLPANMTLHGTPQDPGGRYIYAGITGRF